MPSLLRRRMVQQRPGMARKRWAKEKLRLERVAMEGTMRGLTFALKFYSLHFKRLGNLTGDKWQELVLEAGSEAELRAVLADDLQMLQTSLEGLQRLHTILHYPKMPRYV